LWTGRRPVVAFWKRPSESGPDAGPTLRNAEKLTPLKTVLLVDDVDELREQLRDFLESMNIQVLEAADAAAAIRIGSSHSGNIDLLLTDLKMRGMSGWESAIEIARKRPAMRVLYMSGAISPQEWNDNPEKPAGSYFIQKPFKLEELKELLMAILAE
jgi:two-component system cell cycle sensor histidine kinase/response regulator CckA